MRQSAWPLTVWVAAWTILVGGCQPQTPAPAPAPAPTARENTAPVIDSVTASALWVEPGEAVSLTALAHDEDPDDPLAYAWTARTGLFTDAAQARTEWLIRSGPDEVELTLTVTDSHGASASRALTVSVKSAGEIIHDVLPRVLDVTATPGSVAPGEPTLLTALVSEPDRDPLTYAWSATGCTGTWTEPASTPPSDKGLATGSIRFTPSAPPPGGACDCRLDVVVTDARGGRAREPGQVSLCVREPLPPPGTWAAVSGLLVGRAALRVTPLDSGDVLVVGGYTGPWDWSAEIYQPDTGLSLPTGPMVRAGRANPSVTRLHSGQILVAGGGDADSAELYDPKTNTWSPTGAMSRARQYHTATRLPSGKVLVVGGELEANPPTTAEVYDPATGAWHAVASPAATHFRHTATLLPSGQVLVLGGASAVAERFDPATETWTPTAPPRVARSKHVAVLLSSGQVLVAGGEYSSPWGREPSDSAERYNPESDTWTPLGTMSRPRAAPSALTLASGKVLVTEPYESTAELYAPEQGTWSVTSARPRSCWELARSESGGALCFPGDLGRTTVQRFDSQTERWSSVGEWEDVVRFAPTVTPLPGRVMVVGGERQPVVFYDLKTRAWSDGPALRRGVLGHTATLLPSGKVLVVGGLTDNAPSGLAELYEPDAAHWKSQGGMGAARAWHTATLLPSGQVLVVGGQGKDSSVIAGAELYDPATGRWTSTGALGTARAWHTASLLPSGKVLVVGGRAGKTALDTAELYDPGPGTWSPAGRLGEPRDLHTATVLDSGQVLVMGGQGASPAVEVYDPAAGTWSLRGPLHRARYGHTATLLPSGEVLVVGGEGWGLEVERYAPATATSRVLPPAPGTRSRAAALRLPSGQVLVVGGQFPGVALGLLYTP